MASAAYQRRDAAARAKGYRSYYDYRAHGNGRIPPSAPRLAGGALRRARGHTSAADLVRDSRPGTLITATPDPTSRKKDGSYSRVHVTAIGEDGTDQTYLLQGPALRKQRLQKLISDLKRRGAFLSPSPSLDLSRYQT